MLLLSQLGFQTKAYNVASSFFSVFAEQQSFALQVPILDFLWFLHAGSSILEAAINSTPPNGVASLLYFSHNMCPRVRPLKCISKGFPDLFVVRLSISLSHALRQLIRSLWQLITTLLSVDTTPKSYSGMISPVLSSGLIVAIWQVHLKK